MPSTEQPLPDGTDGATMPGSAAKASRENSVTPTLESINGPSANPRPLPSTPLRPKLNSADGNLQGDGARRTPGGRFVRDPAVSSLSDSRSKSQSPFRLTMPSISPGQLAFTAVRYLPVPMLVLNNLKTVVLANEAMARLIGLVLDETDEEGASAAVETMRGQTLSQVGIDMLQDGRPVWVTWEAFLNALLDDIGARPPLQDPGRTSMAAGDETPTASMTPGPDRRRGTTEGTAQDAVVEVVITRKDFGKSPFDNKSKSKEAEHQIFAKMIVTIWELEARQTFFTLTFTNTQSTSSALTSFKRSRSIARYSILEAADRKSIPPSNPPSVPSSHESGSTSFHSPGVVTMASSPFPPMGPPSAAPHSSAPSLLQKMILMKDALLDNTQMPIVAMWKDGSAIFPNKAARALLRSDPDADSAAEGLGMLHNWQMYNDDFSRRLEPSEYPISRLLATETPFTSVRVGMYDADGSKVIFDVLGEAIRDDHTGEFLAGVVTGRDVTVMTEEISQIKKRDEERFRLICDTMPQLVWTANPDGSCDFFNTRWYNYTGLTPEQCNGLILQDPFHPEDVDLASQRWEHSLKTGEPFGTEIRCRSKEGEYKWYLLRALAVRNKQSGEIEKWFGTCTDVHEGIQTKLSAERTRQQLLSVIAHSHVTIVTIDTNRRVTMLEGALIWQNNQEPTLNDHRWFIGENIYKVFDRITTQQPEVEGRPEWLRAIEDVLEGRVPDDVVQHQLDDRWYRTRFLPMQSRKTQDGKPTQETTIDGVIGVIMDTTELKAREAALREESREKDQAVANEAAAKGASRLKSQFLANMSHEIRTPITGVLGMAELLSLMALDDEQKDCVESIQKSATSLLTVINDILDFSKIESGRLDIEEVRFSLSLIVKDIRKMLEFAVRRKDLSFQAEIDDDVKEDMVVIGDPGRVKQVITNLLTNSIKFTSEGFIKFSVKKEKETADSIEIRFVVQDTGIGIEDETRKFLFQPFSQGDASTARKFGGTGLGLTICKHLAELMHARIELVSEAGSGTTATFLVPFAKSEGPVDPTLGPVGGLPMRIQSELTVSCDSSELERVTTGGSASSGTSTAGGASRRVSVQTQAPILLSLPLSERAKVHILVVEDNPVNQKIAIKTIGKLGFNVTAAWNGREALDYLIAASRGDERKPDIILMDVQMPVIDGYKCTHLLRHHLPYKNIVQDVPIVAMTASAIQGDREKCTKAGMDDYLAKPVTMPTLEQMLIRWCLKRRVIHAIPEPTPSDCSEMGEHCDNADIPHFGIDLDDPTPMRADTHNVFNDLVTPRPLTTNGEHEQSPFDSQSTVELAQERASEDRENEFSNMMQETKLMGAGGEPTIFRGNSFRQEQPSDSLTEENVNKLKIENQQPR